MSNIDSPYNSPTADGSTGRKPLDMQRAFRYPFDHPDWMKNLLLVLVCMFIPVVGPIVYLGYKFEIIESLLDRPKDRYPLLDFGRFSEYLKRGIWPFLAALIAQLIITPLTMLFVFPMACGMPFAIAFAEDADAAALGVSCMIAAMLLMVVGIFALNIIAMMIVTPMMLGAGLAQELGPAINFTFIRGFIARTWKEMFAAYLWLMVVMTLLMPVGLLFFCVGIYIVAAWGWMVMAHVYYQIYVLYLDRGGAKIPVKQPSV